VGSAESRNGEEVESCSQLGEGSVEEEPEMPFCTCRKE
jgi:hypothetical protein